MNDLILLPGPKPSKDDSPEKPTIEITIDPSERRTARGRRRLSTAALAFAGILGVGASAAYLAREAPKLVQAPAASQTELQNQTQRQITALQSEVRELRAKLDAAEQHPPAQAASAPPPSADAKTATGGGEAAPIAQAHPDAEAPTTPAAPPSPAATKGHAAETPPVSKIAPTTKILSGYKLREVSHGVAVLETRRGVVAVRAGNVLPDAGEIVAIQKRAGRWVVSTENGDIIGDAHAQAHIPAPHRRPLIRERYGYEPGPFGPRIFMPF